MAKSFTVKPTSVLNDVKHRAAGDFVVFNGSKRYYPASIGTKQHAEQWAVTQRAKSLMDELGKLINGIEDPVALSEIGHSSGWLIDQVVNQMEKHDPNFDPADPRAFLA